jgi:hypothetical protein
MSAWFTWQSVKKAARSRPPIQEGPTSGFLGGLLVVPATQRVTCRREIVMAGKAPRRGGIG